MTNSNIQSLHCDALIIGTGQAAPALAVALAQQGEQVILVEGAQIWRLLCQCGLHAYQNPAQKRACGAHG
jgi:succinate dehydrogenase/fumarate reductase flavoprotein subunit